MSTPRKPEVEFRSLGLSFAMQSSGEIQITGALGARIPPGRRPGQLELDRCSRAPQGVANVHSLIKTLFPTPANNAGVLIPLTSRVAGLAFASASRRAADLDDPRADAARSAN